MRRSASKIEPLPTGKNIAVLHGPHLTGADQYRRGPLAWSSSGETPYRGEDCAPPATQRWAASSRPGSDWSVSDHPVRRAI